MWSTGCVCSHASRSSAPPCLVRRSCVALAHAHLVSPSLVGQRSGACMEPGVNGVAVHPCSWMEVAFHAEGERGSHAGVCCVGPVSPRGAMGIALTCGLVPACPLVCRLVWRCPGQGRGTLGSLMSGVLACCGAFRGLCGLAVRARESLLSDLV